MTNQNLPATQADLRPSGSDVQAILPRSLTEIQTVAEWYVKAKFTPPGMDSPEKVAVAIMAGMDIGLKPSQSIRYMAVINNRPALWGDGMMGIIQASPMCVWIKETMEGTGDARVAVCETQRRGYPEPTRKTFSVAQAKEAGLWTKQGPWKQYPDRMLQLRARGFCLRDAYSDVLGGLSMSVEELLDMGELVEDGNGVHVPAGAAATPAKPGKRARNSAKSQAPVAPGASDAQTDSNVTDAEVIEADEGDDALEDHGEDAVVAAEEAAAEKDAGGPTEGFQLPTWEVFSADGELIAKASNVDEYCAKVEKLMHDAKTIDDVEAVAAANREVVKTLPRENLLYIAQRKTALIDRMKPPAEEQTQAAETAEAPKKEAAGTWGAFIKQIEDALPSAPNPEWVDSIVSGNQRVFDQMKAAVPDLHKKLIATMDARKAELKA